MNASSSHLTSYGGTNAVDSLLPAPLSNYELSREVEALKARVDCCEELIIYLCDQQEQEQEEKQEKKQQQQQQQQASQEFSVPETMKSDLYFCPEKLEDHQKRFYAEIKRSLSSATNNAVAKLEQPSFCRLAYLRNDVSELLKKPIRDYWTEILSNHKALTIAKEYEHLKMLKKKTHEELFEDAILQYPLANEGESDLIKKCIMLIRKKEKIDIFSQQSNATESFCLFLYTIYPNTLYTMTN
ncbi:uncharacterized protein B0P05DRAFT_590727 [Gilbertella persicaria]|uniref:uncharacterized protein n=1 Tax=Gilbertella persicaria TaxID=101096 RepID=UPI00221F86DD|nr:uncharacterized protein B0P05DRAFT_590727 [Gilbertella persicaria]KAI8060616.1 hypothetical protein B0P05DRAFT_590727 [Gilbertella persicaria]